MYHAYNEQKKEKRNNGSNKIVQLENYKYMGI